MDRFVKTTLQVLLMVVSASVQAASITDPEQIRQAALKGNLEAMQIHAVRLSSSYQNDPTAIAELERMSEMGGPVAMYLTAKHWKSQGKNATDLRNKLNQQDKDGLARFMEGQDRINDNVPLTPQEKPTQDFEAAGSLGYAPGYRIAALMILKLGEPVRA